MVSLTAVAVEEAAEAASTVTLPAGQEAQVVVAGEETPYYLLPLAGLTAQVAEVAAPMAEVVAVAVAVTAVADLL